MEDETQRVDAVIKNQFSGLSRRQVEEAIESGLVVGADGKRLKKGDRLPPTNVQLRRLAEQLESLSKGDPIVRLKVVDQDNDVVVVEKPVGMLCAPKSLFDSKTITSWALARFANLKNEFTDPQPVVTPYSIDADVTGIVLVAKNVAGFKLWQERYEQKKITFSYLAWCWGEPKPHRFFISTQIGKLPGDIDAWAVPTTPEMKFNPPAKDAVTVVRVVERYKRPEQKGFFLAEITMTTNVEHQARVHMAHQGYPVMGDKLYDAEFEKRSPSVTAQQLLLFEMEHGGKRAKTSTDEFKKRFA